MEEKSVETDTSMATMPENGIHKADNESNAEKNDVAIDPKSLNFRQIIKQVDVVKIWTYLGQIRSFVRNRKATVSFRVSTSFEEEFLIRIAEDIYVLQDCSEDLPNYRNCAQVCDRIFEFVESKYGTYQLEYDFGEKNGHKVLKYKIQKQRTERKRSKSRRSTQSPTSSSLGDIAQRMERNLVIEKIPKLNSSIPNVQQNNQSVSSIDTASETSRDELNSPTEMVFPNRSKKKSEKRIERSLVIQKLPVPFLSQSLEKVVSFLYDDEQATLILRPKTEDENFFLTRILILTPKKVKMPVEGYCRRMSLMIKQIMNSDPPFTIKQRFLTALGTSYKEVCYIKVFKMSPSNRLKQQQLLDRNTQKITPCQSSEGLSDDAPNLQITFQNDQHNAENINNNVPTFMNKHLWVRNDPIQENVTKRDVLTDIVKEKSQNVTIDALAARGTHYFEKEPSKNSSDLRNTLIQRRGKPSYSYNKLIEGLSVPLKSDIAMKMMLGMGWDGGSLGVRGDGITEPIMPALNLVNGAGLGHSPTPSEYPIPKPKSLNIPNKKYPKPREPLQFRKDLLQNCLIFLTSNLSVLNLNYNPKLIKKEKKFLVACLRMLQQRSMLTLTETENVIYSQLLDEFRKQPDIMINACVSDCQKEVSLRKHLLTEGVTLKNLQIKDTMADLRLHTDKHIQDLVRNTIPRYQLPKATERLKFKLELLTKIRNIVKNDDIRDMKIDFDKAPTKRQMSFIDNTIAQVNLRVKFGETRPEEALGLEIKEIMETKNFELTFTYDAASKAITIKKNYNTPQTDSVTIKKEDVYTNMSQDPENDSDVEIIDTIIECVSISDDESLNSYNEATKIQNKDQNTICPDENKTDIVKNVNIKEEIHENTVINTQTPVDMDKEINGDETAKTFPQNQEIDRSTDSPEHIVYVDGNDDIEMLIDDRKTFDGKQNEAKENVVIKKEFILDYDEIVEEILSSFTDDQDGFCDISMNEDILLLSDDDEGKPSDNVHCNNVALSDTLVKKDPTVLNIKEEVIDTSHNGIDRIPKDVDIVNIYIVPKNPAEIITRELAKEVQIKIATNIEETQELPLLMCHGVQNDALIYTCYNKKSLNFLEKVLSVTSLKIVPAKEVDKMALTYYCVYDVDCKIIFKMLEMYNKGLSTEGWIVMKKETFSDYVKYLIKMDVKSYKFIHSSNFALYAGVDKAEFSIIWD